MNKQSRMVLLAGAGVGAYWLFFAGGLQAIKAKLGGSGTLPGAAGGGGGLTASGSTIPAATGRVALFQPTPTAYGQLPTTTASQVIGTTANAVAGISNLIAKLIPGGSKVPATPTAAVKQMYELPGGQWGEPAGMTAGELGLDTSTPGSPVAALYNLPGGGWGEPAGMNPGDLGSISPASSPEWTWEPAPIEMLSPSMDWDW